MYKIGLMIMGRPESNQSRVKQIVLQVQAKTKIKNVLEYLHQLDKIRTDNIYISLEKKGRGVGEDSTISQILKHTRPQNGVIKLYLYEGDQHSMEKMELKKSRHQIGSSTKINPQKNKNMVKVSQEKQETGCCCF